MLTIILPYYNEPKYLDWWYQKIIWLNQERPNKVRLMVIDDGSQKQPATTFLKNRNTDYIELFLITEDVGFNNHGARNLGMKQTKTDWNFMTDIDRRYPDETLLDMVDSVINGSLSARNYYRFSPTSDKWPVSVNDFVVHRSAFWETGGYDEEFVNCHWGDRLFFDTLDLIAKLEVKPNWQIKYTRMAREVEYSDVQTTQYPDDKKLIHPNLWKNTMWREGVINYVTVRNQISHVRKRKPILNFPWVRLI